MATPDWRDMYIEHLLADLADTESALVRAVQERESYRELARASLDRISDLTKQNDRLRICVSRNIGVEDWRDRAEAAA